MFQVDEWSSFGNIWVGFPPFKNRIEMQMIDGTKSSGDRDFIIFYLYQSVQKCIFEP